MHADLGLGKIIKTRQKRDAIHVAVAPVTASETLSPGEHVAADGTRLGKHVGIVDPYLEHPVNPGESFWLFLYPNTVTSLRHDWNHPAFKDGAEPVPATMGESEMWLRVYARRVKPYEDAEEAYQNLLNDLRTGELYYHGRDLHSRDDVIDEEDLLERAKVVLGRPVGLHSFSCSC